MRAPLRWLREFVEIDAPAAEIAHRLTMAGTEVGNIHSVGAQWRRIVIGRVVDIARHSGADNLFVARVDIGETTLTLVTAAQNLRAGDVVPVIRAGGQLDERRVIEARRFRGITSEGMLCAGAELGISDDDEHIYVLEPDAPIGMDLAAYLGDEVFDVELTPNRPDCFGIVGIAREIGAITGATVRLPWQGREKRDGSSGSDSPLRVFVDDRALCPRYTGQLLTNVHVAPSPPWLQRRLHLCGVRPISNVVDVSNYVMLELGQPLHTFDADRLRDLTIRVRPARVGERITTIDGVERELSPDMLVIADSAAPVALAGIMGGGESEITGSTTRVVLESATFSAASIRRTSRTIHLQTEASKRFDKGLDPELPPLASRRAAEMLAELAEATLEGALVDVDAHVPPPEPIRFSARDVQNLIGHAYPGAQIESVLSRLGFAVRRDGDEFVATPPTWRRDVEGKADISEEVARVVGYDVIPVVLPSGALPPTHEDPTLRWESVLRSAVAAAGLQEVITYSLVDPYAQSRLDAASSFPEGPPDPDAIPVANPQSIDRSRLRTSLLPSLLSTVASNLRYQTRVAIFEIARVYLPPLAPLPREERRLAIAMAGRRDPADWNANPSEFDFFDIKAAIEAAMSALNVPIHVVPGSDA